jgi:hypothetical protein
MQDAMKTKDDIAAGPSLEGWPFLECFFDRAS